MIEWRQKSKPKKIPRASNKPQKIPGPKFNPPKKPTPNFRAIKISRGTTQPGYVGIIRRNYHESSDCLEYSINTYLNQPTQKNTHQNFSTQKTPEIENFTPIKILQSSLPLEIRSTPPPWMVVHFILGLQNKVVVNSYTIQTKKDITAFP